MERIEERKLVRNLTEGASTRAQLGISGRLDRSDNDGRVTRFGWKAQNISAMVFSGEANNVEMGITNDTFQTERDETPACQFSQLPNDVTNVDGVTGTDTISAIEKFAFFMRFLGAPIQSTTTPGGNASIAEGFNAFVNIGGAHCETAHVELPALIVSALLRPRNMRFFPASKHLQRKEKAHVIHRRICCCRAARQQGRVSQTRLCRITRVQEARRDPNGRKLGR